MEDDQRALLDELQDAPPTPAAETTELDQSDEQVVGGPETPAPPYLGALPRPGAGATASLASRRGSWGPRGPRGGLTVSQSVERALPPPGDHAPE